MLNLIIAATPVGQPTPPMSPVTINSRIPQSGPLTISVEHTASMQRPPTTSTVLPERVWQECVLGGPPHTGPADQSSSGQWDFVDPTKRTSCTCSK